MPDPIPQRPDQLTTASIVLSSWAMHCPTGGPTVKDTYDNVDIAFSATVRTLTNKTLTGAKLTAGTATVAPLTLFAGTNLTTPVNGSVEYDGTNFYFTVGGTRKTVAFTDTALPSQTGNSGKFLTTNGTVASWSTVTTGTVTSVALSAPAIFGVSGSPVTTSGTLTLSLATQSANVVWAGPSTGSPATPTFRSLVASDIPTTLSITAVSNLTGNGFVKTSGGIGTLSIDSTTYLTGNQTITLSGDISGSGTTAITTTIGANKVTNAMLAGSIDLTAKVTGALPIANGGTGQSAKTAAYNALTPLTTLGDTAYHDGTNALRLAGNITTTKQFLSQTGNGTVSAAPAWSAVSKSDVGLGSVENTALSTWAGSTNLTTLGTVATGTWSATTIALNKGGTGATTQAGAANAVLPSQASNSGKYLTTNGTDVSWASIADASLTAAADATNAAQVVPFLAAATGSTTTLNTDTDLTYNPSTNVLTAKYIAADQIATPNTPGSYGSTQTDLVLTNAATHRISSSTAISINSIAPPSGESHISGRRMSIVNVGSNNITFVHLAGSGTAANKMFCAPGVDIVLGPNDRLELEYDSTSRGDGSAGWRAY